MRGFYSQIKPIILTIYVFPKPFGSVFASCVNKYNAAPLSVKKAGLSCEILNISGTIGQYPAFGQYQEL